MATSSDVELWKRAQDGEATAFGELYERHARAVQAYCLWRTAAQQLAEDITSATFLEAWRRRRSLDLTTESAVPLLLGVATNLLRNHWRSQRRHARALARIANATPPLGGGSEEEAIARVDAVIRIRVAGAGIRALPRREREVLGLLAWGELSYAEAAAALGIPIGTVRSRVARARSRLGASLADVALNPSPAEDSP